MAWTKWANLAILVVRVDKKKSPQIVSSRHFYHETYVNKKIIVSWYAKVVEPIASPIIVIFRVYFHKRREKSFETNRLIALLIDE